MSSILINRAPSLNTQTRQIRVPAWAADALDRFLAREESGCVKLHVQRGVIQAIHVEAIYKPGGMKS